LSIGELAQRTGMPAATLRSWEDRYGFPRPPRLARGHRRYQDSDIALIGKSCDCVCGPDVTDSGHAGENAR